MNRLVSEQGVAITLLACLIATAGCGGPSEPTPDYEIALDVRLVDESVGGGTQLKAIATARNVGALPVSYVVTCTYGSLLFTIRDAQGNLIPLTNPCSDPPVCPPQYDKLEPGESSQKRLIFDGTTWDAWCEKRSVASGRYELRVEFFFRTEDWERKTETKFFEWIEFRPVSVTAE
jgi:hypothetical protein